MAGWGDEDWSRAVHVEVRLRLRKTLASTMGRGVCPGRAAVESGCRWPPGRLEMGTPGLPGCSSPSEYRLELWGISVHVLQSDNPKLLNLPFIGPSGVWERA